MRRSLKIIALSISLAVIAGCATTDGGNGNRVFRDETVAERAARKDAEKEERREIRAARFEEAEDERAARKARREYKREARRKQLDEQLRTKLSLNLDQRVSVGTLQVNTDQLKKLIDARDKEYKKRLKIYEEANAEHQHQERLRLLDEAKRWSRLKQQQSVPGQGDSCCVPPPDCAQPFLPIRAPLKQPLKQPILPMEIPLMLPVTLQVALDNPRIRETKVRRLSLKEECKPRDSCCDSEPPCDDSGTGGERILERESAGYSRIGGSSESDLPSAPPFNEALNEEEDSETAIE